MVVVLARREKIFSMTTLHMHIQAVEKSCWRNISHFIFEEIFKVF